jgi:predicted PurR-regulated permease PerM
VPRYSRAVDETPRREIALPKEFYVVLGVALSGYLLYTLRAVLTPLFLAFAIAYVLDPVIDRLEAWKLPRPAGIAIVLVTALAVITTFMALVLPGVASDIASVASELPGKIGALVSSADPWLSAHGIKVPHTTTEWVERLGANANELASSILAPAGGVLSTLVSSGFSMAGSAVAIAVVPVLSVYFLNDFDRITAGIRSFLPRRYRRVVTAYAKEIDATLSHFIRGQLTVMAIVAVLYAVAYSILGVRLALVVGVMAGLLSFIPYLGSAFALISGLLMSLLGGFNPAQLLGVVVAYAIVQTLEGFVIQPRVMGKSVGLPEMWVLIALFVGGQIFGFLGVLLAVPAAAVAKIFVTRAVDIYHESDLYLEGPASLRSIPPGEIRSSSAPPPSAPSNPPTMPAVPTAPPVAPADPGDTSRAPSSAFETPLAGSVVPRQKPQSDPPKS